MNVLLTKIDYKKPMKISTLESSAKKAITTTNTVQQVQMKIDLFGRMLPLSLEKNIAVGKILSCTYVLMSHIWLKTAK